MKQRAVTADTELAQMTILFFWKIQTGPGRVHRQ